MTPVAGSLKKGLASVAAPAERQAHFTALQSSHTHAACTPNARHGSPAAPQHLTLSAKALAATRRSCVCPFRFSMMLLPWTQAVVLSISATSCAWTLQAQRGQRREGCLQQGA